MCPRAGINGTAGCWPWDLWSVHKLPTSPCSQTLVPLWSAHTRLNLIRPQEIGRGRDIKRQSGEILFLLKNDVKRISRLLIVDHPRMSAVGLFLTFSTKAR